MQISCEIMTFGAESLEAQVRASMLKSPGYSFKPSHIHFFFFFFTQCHSLKLRRQPPLKLDSLIHLIPLKILKQQKCSYLNFE